jgi:hypothetical protein
MAKASRIIRLVRNDYGESITWNLTDRSTGDAIDLTNATAAIMYFRAKNGTTILASPSVSLVAPLTAGQVRLTIPSGMTNQEPGFYEGEIQITLTGGGFKTVYDLVQFQIREDVGP